MLVKQSQTAVLPVAISGLGELKAKGRGWFRSGKIDVHFGAPLLFGPEATEAEITDRLHASVASLMNRPTPLNEPAQFR
jgi:long-chain acyl-CoA synthetase